MCSILGIETHVDVKRYMTVPTFCELVTLIMSVLPGYFMRDVWLLQ